jgi:hypothetical protein
LCSGPLAGEAWIYAAFQSALDANIVADWRKDASKGGRGSNSLNGAADVTMLVEKNESFSSAAQHRNEFQPAD